MPRASTSKMSDAQISRAAALFATLAEPSRLRLLQSLLGGSTLTVTELVAATGLSQANVSKHLSVLHSARLVSKTRDGIFVKYEIADNLVSQLCALVCSKMERDLLDDAKALGQ